MKFPFKFVKKSILSNFQDQLKQRDTLIKNASDFINEIERGNLNQEYTFCANEDKKADVLSESLISMRDQMKKISLEEKERNWATEGLAKFVDILRNNNDDLKLLGDNIISQLVKYVEANQGALFILNEDNIDEYLELYACYAYGKKKFLEKRIEIGQGLVGQTFLEKQTTHITTIPKDYVAITSGLGEATPRNILLVPLRINEKVYGVVELAFFKPLPDYKISFVERLGESIASTISSAKINQKTKILLEASQQQAEELRSQEEEVRQNMEELSATQEEMQRVLKEVQGNEQFMKDLLDASSDSILTIDKEYKLIVGNEIFRNTYKGTSISTEKGAHMQNLFSAEQWGTYKKYYDRVFAGETFQVSENYKLGNIEQHFIISFSPLRDETNAITGAAIFGKDITELETNRRKTEELLHESQSQAEELKAQEEELRQNMEELSATQEEMEKILTQTQSQERFVTDLINATSDTIFTVDKNFDLLIFNKTFQRTWEAQGFKVEKGINLQSFYSDAQEWKQHEDLYKRVFANETFSIKVTKQIGDQVFIFSINYSPINDQNGEVVAAAVFGKDVTEQENSHLKTEELLHESQSQAEELRAQEEELRQNMEELSATQEEMERIMREVRSNEKFMKDIIDASSDSILTVDRSYRIINANKVVENTYKGTNILVEKGTELETLLAKEEWSAQKALYDRAFKGEAFAITEAVTVNNAKVYFILYYSPLKNEHGEIIAVAVFGKDITELEENRKKAEELLHESQGQAEELKAQEEELRQNMEELSATQEQLVEKMRESEAVKAQVELRETVLGHTTILSESDAFGTITYVNDKFCQVSQYSREELIGKPHNILRHPDMPKALFKLMWETIKKGEIFKGIIKNKTKGGGYYWVDATIVPIKDGNGKIQKYVGARYHLADDDVAALLYQKQEKKLQLKEQETSKK